MQWSGQASQGTNEAYNQSQPSWSGYQYQAQGTTQTQEPTAAYPYYYQQGQASDYQQQYNYAAPYSYPGYSGQYAGYTPQSPQTAQAQTPQSQPPLPPGEPPQYLSAARPKVKMQFGTSSQPPLPPPETPAATPRENTSPSKRGQDAWPPALRKYVERAFENCQTDFERTNTEGLLKKKITSAANERTLWDVDWDAEPLPGATAKKKAAKKKAAKPMQISTVKSRLSRVAVEDEPLSPKSKKRNKRKKSELDSPPATAAEVAKRQKRAQRFSKHERVVYNSSYKASARTRRVAEDETEDDWDKYTVVGTSTSREKQFLRLTSAPNPATIRPLPVLREALKMVKRKWRSEPNYKYAWNQMKAIRQDLTVQRIRNAFTVDVYETHARIALENADMGEYNQCQAQLLQLKQRDGLEVQENEFTAYRILYNVHIGNNTELTSIISGLTAEERMDPAVDHAMQVRTAAALGNYHKFFKLYLSAPNMGAYVMDQFVGRTRKSSLKAMSKAYMPSITVAFISSELAFPSERKCRKFLEEMNVVFRGAEGIAVDCRKTYAVLNKS